ncbi:VWA domain-containing protein [bacterium 1XD21-13]|nr:VWA domain-containing protein [bacterium 1XD21-13]
MKRRNQWLCRILAVFLLLMSCPVTVQAGQETAEQHEDVTLAPYFLVESEDPSLDQFPLKATQVQATINGTIAEIHVTQTYANQGEQPINAKYVFPASTRTAVHGMTMTVGSHMVRAQIKEKEEAKEVYEEAKSEGKNASLLEEQRSNVFTMDVANIMPGDEIAIELTYTELIEPEEGIYQFVFPTVVGPRYSRPMSEKEAEEDDWVESPYLEEGTPVESTYDISVSLSTGVPIENLSSRSHKIEVQQDQDTRAKVTLADNNTFAGDRDFILEYQLTGETMNSGLTLYEGENANFFQLTVQPPKRYNPQDIPPREYIFALDVSGSMDGYALDTAKELIRDLVSNLREADRFNVILFSDTVWTLAPNSLEAVKPNIDRALQLIEDQKGGGGTELLSALLTAYHIPKEEDTARTVVMITDGYISDEKEIFEHIRENLGDTSYFAFGIGSSVNRYLIEGIAATGMGEDFVVTEEAQAQEAAERFRTYVQAPLLTNVQVEFQGFETYDMEPSGVPTLYASRPIVLYGKWRGEPTGTIRITGKRGGEDYVEEIPVTKESISQENEAIQYLWARKRVEMLTDYSSKSGGQVQKEVTSIGLKYSMVTPYTSFVAVIEEVRNPEGDSKDVDQPNTLPFGVSGLSVGGGYMVGAEPDGILLVLMLGVLVLLRQAYGVFRRRAGGNEGL